MRKAALIFILSIGLVHFNFSQDKEDRYSKELNVGINFNTNGGIIGGFSMKYMRRINENNLHVFSLDLLEVKHLKEQRTTSFQTGQAFIFGKQNNLFALRPQYGREITLFRKYPEEGIKLSAYFGIGPSLGFVKPYFVEYDATQPGDTSIQVVPFTEELDPSRVLRGGFPFRGFGQMQLQLGVNFKAGLNFEFSKKRPEEEVPDRPHQHVTGIETGFSFEAFGEQIPILGFAQNKSTYTAVYVVLYYGRRW